MWRSANSEKQECSLYSTTHTKRRSTAEYSPPVDSVMASDFRHHSGPDIVDIFDLIKVSKAVLYFNSNKIRKEIN